MEPIIIKTGQKLTKFWDMTRLSLTSVMLAVWIGTFHFYFNFTLLQQIYGLGIFIATTCLAHAIHYYSVVTVEYSIGMLGLYGYEASLNKRHPFKSKRICKLQEIREIYIQDHPRSALRHFLVIETPKQVIKISVFGSKCIPEALRDDIRSLSRRYKNLTDEQLAIQNLANMF
jgi:hypothetical protein